MGCNNLLAETTYTTMFFEDGPTKISGEVGENSALISASLGVKNAVCAVAIMDL